MMSHRGRGVRAIIWPIGPQDLTLDGMSARGHGCVPRAFGERLLAQFEDVQTRLQVPPLDQAIAYLRDIGEAPHQVVLVVTDHAPGSTSFDEDTCTFGP